MIPIHQLLSLIRWDREFDRVDFEIGHYARVLARISHVLFTTLIFPPDDHYAILLGVKLKGGESAFVFSGRLTTCLPAMLIPTEDTH